MREPLVQAPARRRGDLVDSAAMLGMVRFLMARPTCAQICQEMALNLLSAHQPRSVMIALFGADGSLHVVGEFGLAQGDLEQVSTVSLWDGQPMADAVRNGEPVLVSDASSTLHDHGRILGLGPDAQALVAWPLTLPSQRVGVLQVSFATPVDSSLLRADLTGVSAVLALYLSLLTSISALPDRAVEVLGAIESSQAFPAGEFASLHVRASARKPAPSRLSPRQQEVLTLIAQDLTNAQIAKRIGFSESTVRQETMVIYRYFGVGGRQDAVAQARARGILASA